MSTLDSPEMMRAVIMDHYVYPRNKKLKGDSRYFKVHMDSESCIDDIYIEALIEDGIIKDVFAQDLGTHYNAYGIAVRTGQHCAKLLPNHLKVPSVVRASFYFYNTKDEIDKF